MRVLYGIQGTGNGHLARARALVPALQSVGIELDFVLTGRRREDYFNMELFGDFACYDGLSLVTERGSLKVWRTLGENNIKQFLRDMHELDVSDYDLVLSDFEPLTAWAARRYKVPAVGISHQCAFDFAVPKVRGYLASSLLMRTFAPTATRVGLHWHHFNQPILPPLIEPMQPTNLAGNKIVVYMGFEEVDDIVAFVRPFTEYKFIIYARVPAEQQLGHLTIKPLSHSDFHADLLDCFGVISNAGFELSSECLALGKKLLVKPLAGQFEQLSNALALQALKRGTVIASLDQRTLGKWLAKPCYRQIEYPDVAKALAAWIAAGRKQSLESLATELWQDFDMPLAFDRRFGRSLLPGLVT